MTTPPWIAEMQYRLCSSRLLYERCAGNGVGSSAQALLAKFSLALTWIPASCLQLSRFL